MSPGDLLTFRSLSTTVLQQNITGLYPLSQYFCNVCSLKKKKSIHFFCYQNKTIKVKNMGKSNLCQPTIVKSHIWFSHVHFAYWKIEAFWSNEAFKSLLQVMAKFNPSSCLLPWSVWLLTEALPFSHKEGLWTAGA